MSSSLLKLSGKVLLVWLSIWSESFAFAQDDANATPSSLASIKFQYGLTFLVPAYPGVPKKRPLINVNQSTMDKHFKNILQQRKDSDSEVYCMGAYPLYDLLSFM